MPMDSRSRTTKTVLKITQNEDTHLTKQPLPTTQPKKQNVAKFGFSQFL